MNKNQHSEIKIAIIGAAFGVIFTAIYDWIKAKPILSTFVSFCKWLWKNIFQVELSIWQILLAIFLFLIIKGILKNFKKETTNDTLDENHWLNYKEDSIDGVKWKWNWQKNTMTGKMNIDDLRPVCPNCETPMDLHESGSYQFADCPRCEKILDRFKSPPKVEAVIIDNIQRNLYSNRSDTHKR